ncbi:MAG: hypothetical protein MZU79_07335 [Anaerotruncus sp.]|nr:hypothetical protein [Anaerotruncus sp.]
MSGGPPDAPRGPSPTSPAWRRAALRGAPPPPRRRGRPPIKPIAYGTPREDAFRRDLTINALFYDIATYSVIDYVGGLDDLAARRVRIIGDPDTSYTEDPVRIWRVLRHSSRLGFTIEERTAAAIARHLDLLLAACPGARLYEELNKDIKSGSARAFFQSRPPPTASSPASSATSAPLYDSARRGLRAASPPSSASLDASIARAAAPRRPKSCTPSCSGPGPSRVLAAIEGDRPKALYDAFRARQGRGHRAQDRAPRGRPHPGHRRPHGPGPGRRQDALGPQESAPATPRPRASPRSSSTARSAAARTRSRSSTSAASASGRGPSPTGYRRRRKPGALGPGTAARPPAAPSS